MYLQLLKILLQIIGLVVFVVIRIWKNIFGRDYTTYYKCTICGLTSTFVPDIQLILPPIVEEEELTE